MGKAAEFLDTDVAEWRRGLEAHLTGSLGFKLDPLQGSAWIDEFKFLRTHIESLIATRSEATAWSLVFEYELPREGGRRPDLVVLTGSAVAVVEFKGASRFRPAHVDQVAAYARDLAAYHIGCRDLEVVPILVLANGTIDPSNVNGVHVVSQRGLDSILGSLPSDAGKIDVVNWIRSDYAPLPSLLRAAYALYRNKPLPNIRQAQSAGVGDTVTKLTSIKNAARQQERRHLALVTGVPGAGKTLVGLDFVHQEVEDNESRAVYLSGNEALVRVLRYALDIQASDAFVQQVHAFTKEYCHPNAPLPREHVWVYDEAQRAWDAERVMASPRKRKVTEPQEFVELADRMSRWAMIVGLVGEGQELLVGEEQGIRLWVDAVSQSSNNWFISCPPHLARFFATIPNVEVCDTLNLSLSLRTHLASDVQSWIVAILEDQLDTASQFGADIAQQGFRAYVTRDLAKAKQYVMERYADEPYRRFGLLRSTGDRYWQSLPDAVPVISRKDPGPWYVELAGHARSCRQLKSAATEFTSQGLELDVPIVQWGNDLKRDQNRWIVGIDGLARAKQPRQLRLNSYRVLLSRGRDGLVAVIPPRQDFDETFRYLRQAGFQELIL